MHVHSDKAEPTSFWVEMQKDSASGLHQYRNNQSQGYLGYDPHCDFTYTKSQSYGAEDWQLTKEELSENDECCVVLFANYGEKFLGIVNGKLTGLSERTQDCVWVFH